MRTCIVRAQTQSFLCGKFSTARLEVLPNLRHAGVFQMSKMVNFGIGLTRRWAFALRLCKITGDIQIPDKVTHTFSVVLRRRGASVLWSIKYMFFRSFTRHCPWNSFTLFFFLAVNSSVYAARSSSNGACRRIFHGKCIKSKTFAWLGKVATNRWCRVWVLLRTFLSSIFLSLFFFPFLFCFVFAYLFCCFSINTYRKIPKISPGAYIFQRPFLRGLYLEGQFNGGFFALMFGGAYTCGGAYFRNFTVPKFITVI